MEIKREQSTAEKLFCFAFGVAVFYLVMKYLAGILMPFVTAWILSLAISPLAEKTGKATHMPGKFWAFVYVTFIIFLLGTVIYLAVCRLAGELESLIGWLSEDGNGAAGAVGDVIRGFGEISSRVPFIERLEKIDGLENIREKIDILLAELLQKAVSGLTSRIPQWLASVVSAAPKFFLTFIVTLMACYYFSMDNGKLRSGIKMLIPKAARPRVMKLVNVGATALKRYGKAYLLLMLITFIEVFVGLMMLGRKYAFLAALGIAVVDILPVLGAGTVLIPWAVIALLCKNYSLGFGLLILYGVITIIRQIIEPRIVGSSIGLHPIAALVSMYVGFCLFGIIGMLLGPAAALLIGEAIKEREA